MIILMSVEKTYIDDDEDGDDKDDDTVPHLVSGAVHLSTDGAALLLAVTCLFNASWQELLDRHILNHVHAQLMYAVLYSVSISRSRALNVPRIFFQLCLANMFLSHSHAVHLMFNMIKMYVALHLNTANLSIS